MPMPWAIRRATKDLQAFRADAQEELGTPADHSTHMAVDGALQTFRRLTVTQGLAR
jgi:5,10-methenyltetrahydromethanopterin hydrogenase